ncbi:DUF4855 domain-containing protein [Brevibacillus dissolubilis]|uniref:DUF4855 domain-containing protein n=1 Tax=Brevibacillus dissolubilis TaxID=1844116 RepID=UPI0011168CF6|nr:DUF4855 domain-containing protein [Brevibacillus dissolubilis]
MGLRQYFHKTITWTLACALVLPLVQAVPVSAAAKGQTTVELKPSAAATAFADVKGHYSEKAISHLLTLHLIQPNQAKKYNPTQPMARQDVMVLLAKAIGLQPSSASTAAFKDLGENPAMAPYLKAFADAGLLKGRPDGTIGVNDAITRQDLAVLIDRMMQQTGVDTSDSDKTAQPPAFSDEADIADYAKQGVRQAASQGWMIGSYGNFAPRKKVTRADAAIIAERIVLRRLEQADQAEFTVQPARVSVLAGTTQKLTVFPKGSDLLPYTPVYAFDRPDLGRVLADGTFVAGPNEGTGQLTVTVGNKTMAIPVEVTPDGRPATNVPKPEGDRQKADGTSTSIPVVNSNPTGTNGTTGSGSATGSQPKSGETTPSIPSKPGETKPLVDPYDKENGIVNLSLGQHVGVRATDPSDLSFNEMEKKYPGPVGGLVADSETWTGYLRQAGREVTVTLDQVKTLDRVQLTFKQEKKAGITLPPYMEVEVSRDGKVWSSAGKATHAVAPDTEQVVVRTLSLTFPGVEAKYVRVRFPVKVFVFARELQVYGHEKVIKQDRTVLLPPVQAPGPMPEDKKANDRIKNLVLAFSGGYGELGTWRKEDFMPLVGYINPEGKVMDQMFDSVLFMPYPNMPATRAGWEYYLDDLFQSGRQIDALNEAMKEYNKARGTLVNNPMKEKVVLTLPYPNTNVTEFGKLEEDRDPLTFQASRVGAEKAYQYRTEAMEWYLNEVLKRWEAANPSYLRLEGIYWYAELIEDAIPKERELMQHASQIVHEKGLHFYWIPYFGSSGVGDWKSMGFDYAFLQPNFYANQEQPIERMETTLETANKYGMGIEIEGDERMTRDAKYYRIYYNQLIAAHRLGIDKDKIHAYYYGSKSLQLAYNSKDPKIRAIYDDTYKWLSGKFTITEYLTPVVTPTPTPTTP